MDDGNADGTNRRGRSREHRSRTVRNQESEQKEASAERGKSEERKGAKTQKRRGRPPGRKNARSRSTSRTPSRVKSKTPESEDRRAFTREDGDSTPSKDLNGETGRAVKMEIIELNAKVQQTLGFTHVKTPAKMTSAQNPIILDGAEDQSGSDTQSTRSSHTSKRKQGEMTKGISKEPSGAQKRMTPQRSCEERGRRGQRDGGQGGRIHGRGRGGRGGRGDGQRHQDIQRHSTTEADMMMTEPPGTPPNEATTAVDLTHENGETGRRGQATTRESFQERTNETSIDIDSDMEEPPNTRITAGTGQGFCIPSPPGGTKDGEDAGTPIKRGGAPMTHDTTNNTLTTQTNQDNTSKRETPRVPNPYKAQRGTTPVTYASVTKSPQTKLTTHQKIMEAHDSFFEVTFYAQELSKDPSMAEIIAVLKAQIKSILMRAKEVDRKAKINAWMDASDLPTIAKVEDIPDSPSSLHAYLSPLRRDKTIVKGRNSNWRVRITTHIPRQAFLHYWGLSKRDFVKTSFIPLRSAPLQAPTYHAAGYFLNSSDGQLTDTLEAELTKTLGHRVGIAYKSAALHKRAADEYWKMAKEARDRAPEHDKARAYFKNLPMVMQVYAETRMEAKATAYKLNELYGSTEVDGMYPRMPDGTRMRFVAAHVYVDMTGRATAANLFKQQMLFQQFEVTAPIPIRDPDQRFKTQGNKTMHELVMDLQDPENKNEPYFRNMKRKFHWNYKTKEYEVNIHSGMYQSTAQILRRFKAVMTERYGDEVGEAILDGEQEDVPQEYGSQSAMTGISIATDDRYLNGEAQFLIVGMEKVREAEERHTPADIRQGDADENTIHIRSTTSGMTGHTGQTVPSVQGVEEGSTRTATMTRERSSASTTREELEMYHDAHDPGPAATKDNMEIDTTTEESTEGRWSTVTSQKGAKPRQPTLMEKAFHYATHLSGTMGGQNP